MFLRKFLRHPGREDPVEAVVENLNNILNTKKGFGSYVRELGIGDWNEFQSREKIIETIIEEIRENIRLFEPRVQLTEISEAESDSAFRIRFEVKCVFAEGSRPIFIVLDSSENRISVED